MTSLGRALIALGIVGAVVIGLGVAVVLSSDHIPNRGVAAIVGALAAALLDELCRTGDAGCGEGAGSAAADAGAAAAAPAGSANSPASGAGDCKGAASVFPCSGASA